MTPPLDTCLHGDALTVLRTLPDECVQTCVTSPPYWGLRDYGTATWEGGREDCEHEGDSMRTAPPGTDKQASNVGASAVRSGDCRLCGARRIDSQLGLEPTPEEYVARMVEVFREVRRVLRDDGTCWINLGDSYWNGGAEKRDGVHDFVDGGKVKLEAAKGALLQRKSSTAMGLKPKDLVGIPWRVAFALQADGWFLRQDIIWHKPNPMPESVSDRCTKAHEYLFLLSKSPRYFYDAEAVREPHVDFDRGAYGERVGSDDSNRAQPGVRTGTFNIDAKGAPRAYNPAGRNRRSVWTVPSAPYPEAHFATFPRALIEPCILAGAPSGGLVLDPFLGSGTTAQVAQDLGRRWLGIELNAEYIALQSARTAQTAMVL